jgi:uncharacterized protein YecE (DUF72 family)
MAIYVGTCGWSYPSGEGKWDGVFYRPGLADREKLPYYARFFSTVEVNSSFYRPLYPNMSKAWVQRTPDDFKFCVKLYQKFTHPKMFEEATGEHQAPTDEDFDLAHAGLEPLAASGKLGALLAQFPPSFKADPARFEYLTNLVDRLSDYPLAVELRHASWKEYPDTSALFREHETAWVMIDEPRFRSSIGEVPLTSKLGYFRFHGRNYKEWWAGDRESRYNYLYTAPEQAELSLDVKEVAEKTADTFVFYNNHYRAKAVVNALEMKSQLSLPLPTAEDVSAELVAEYPKLREVLGEGVEAEAS